MISIVYCTREPNPEHVRHLKKTAGHPKVEVIEYVNNGESLTKFYNQGLKDATNDIVVFCHDDIEIKTKNWAVKLNKHFSKNPEYGIIGIAGTKSLSDTGRWWDDRTAMYGRVEHTHEGKSWLSIYSADQANRVEETILVDGLFFGVSKNRIKENFSKSVEGFHFYDVDFCFRNYLEGVKVGVITNVRVNHMSIGETNQEWEQNRILFSEAFADKLPVKIEETFEHRKLKVLIGCLSFAELTGSEISTLETAKGLVKAGVDVTVTSPSISEKFIKFGRKYGFKVVPMQEPPFYKLGDGEWSLYLPDGTQQKSKKGMLYKMAQEDFDIIHANHTPVTEKLLQLYPEAKFVNIVRSEVISLEDPIIDERIKKYIAIRPTIKDHLGQRFDIAEDDITVIYNPFDHSRFKVLEHKPNDKKIILFVGTMDYLRQAAIDDLIEKCKTDGSVLWLVGKDTNGYASEYGQKYDCVEYFPPTDKIEDFYHKCDETAGIFLGRTTIEGFLCGKPAWIYMVDKAGTVVSHDFHEVPEDMSIFDNTRNIEKIKQTYIEVYNG